MSINNQTQPVQVYTRNKPLEYICASILAIIISTLLFVGIRSHNNKYETRLRVISAESGISVENLRTVATVKDWFGTDSAKSKLNRIDYFAPAIRSLKKNDKVGIKLFMAFSEEESITAMWRENNGDPFKHFNIVEAMFDISVRNAHLANATNNKELLGKSWVQYHLLTGEE